MPYLERIRERANSQIQTDTLPDFPALTKALGTRFLDLVSCDRERYVKNLVYPGTGEPGYEPYNLNPLLKWPLIKIGEDAYVVPSPRDLLERGSSGVYYDLMPIDKGRFGAVLGDAFQEYVGIIMKGLPGIPMVFPETKYFLKGAKRVTCDWIIVDEDTAVLIECKRSAVNALSKVTGARARIKEDISNPNGVVDGVLKILETEQAIRQRYKGLGFLSKVKRFYGLVVVLDDFYMPNSPFVRQIASEALEKHKVALEDRIQFAHVGGLEWLVNLLARPGTSVSAVMHAKTNTSAHVVLDFKNFVPDYATEQLPGEKITPWMSQFNEVYEEFKRDVI